MTILRTRAWPSWATLAKGPCSNSTGKFDPALVDVRRKTLCQYLAIGESTYTGWVQAGRIPRAAAIAYTLHRNLQQRARRIRALKQERLEPRVVVVDDMFAICEFRENEHGEIEGRLVATGISDQSAAHDMARLRSRAFTDVLEEAIELLRFYRDSDPDQLQRVGEVADKLENFRDPGRLRRLEAEIFDLKRTQEGSADSPGKVEP